LAGAPQQYELLVSELLEARLRDELPVTRFRVFRDKIYPGKSGHAHQIDVSAELEVAGAFILIPVECKLYSRKVGIDDVMEFATRIDDIGAHKGIIVTTNGFQKGAVQLAQSKGIALVRAYDLVWVPVLHSPYDKTAFYRARQQNLEGFLRWFYHATDLQLFPQSVVQSLASTDYDLVDGICNMSEFGSHRDGHVQRVFHVVREDSEGNEYVRLDASGIFTLLAAQRLGDATHGISPMSVGGGYPPVETEPEGFILDGD
jgi:hypothetical protein